MWAHVHYMKAQATCADTAMHAHINAHTVTPTTQTRMDRCGSLHTHTYTCPPMKSVTDTRFTYSHAHSYLCTHKCT